MTKKLSLKLAFHVMTTYEDGSEDLLETFDSYEKAEMYITNDMPYSGGEFWIKKVWIDTPVDRKS